MALDISSFAAEPRVTDGVYGTQLQKMGLVAGGCVELLNAERPDAIEAVARSYVEAGSDVIMTNTLGANRITLAAHGASERAAELAEAAARISRRAAAGKDTRVFGSFGPTGKIVMMGEVSEAELSAGFEEVAAALADGGVEAIVLETFNELAEARIALDAVKRATDLPVIVSMTFSFGPDRTATMMGDTPADLSRMCEEGEAAAVGANCGLGPDRYVEVTRLLREAGSLPVWIKPNAGLPVVRKGRTVFPMTPEEFASHVPKLLDAGADFIGGCCGTDADFIRAIRKAVDGRT
jgi:methionine synthase I (cobalamin-dependent)